MKISLPLIAINILGLSLIACNEEESKKEYDQSRQSKPEELKIWDGQPYLGFAPKRTELKHESKTIFFEHHIPIDSGSSIVNTLRLLVEVDNEQNLVQFFEAKTSGSWLFSASIRDNSFLDITRFRERSSQHKEVLYSISLEACENPIWR